MLRSTLALLLCAAAPAVNALLLARPMAPVVAAPACSSCRALVAESRGALGAVQMKEKEQKDVLELDGIVLESLRGASFRVQIQDSDQVLLAHISGKIRKNYIKILVGDRVTMEISPYDLTKARITFRHKN